MRYTELLEDTIKLKSDQFKRLITPAVRKLDNEFSRNGFEIRIVGGAVRDLLLGKDPKDIDMATDAVPEEAMKLLDAVGIRHEPTGLQHGTITAIIDGEPIEITTLRIDAETDGRHAEVQFTKSWEEDAERRDLTYNAMSLDIIGNLYDYFGGAEDLKAGKTQFVGSAEKRIQEDYLRILRYFRFFGRQKNANWDKETLTAIAANSEGLQQISGERIWAEMFKILAGDHVIEILNKMKASKVGANMGLPIKNLNVVKRLIGSDPRLLVAAMLDTPAEVKTLRARWKFDNPTNKMLEFLVKHKNAQLDLKAAQQMIAMDNVDNTMVRQLLHFQGKSNIARKLKGWKPEFPVSGKDLMAAGMKSGPELGQVLKTLKQEWIDSGYQLTQQELVAKLG